MSPKQKQTIIKKPAGTGNISITIENNLKNTNPAPPVVKKRRRRRPKVGLSDETDETLTNSKITDMLRGGGGSGGGGGGGGGIPTKDVSYIKPPSDRFTVWRNYMNDSFNTTTPIQTTTQAIPEAQARQMGYLPPVPTVPLALPAPPPPPVLPAPPPQPALTNALPQMFLTYMQQQEERNRDRENTLIQMFRNRNNENNENMGFNSDGRINELPEENEEQVNEDLRNEGVTQEQLDFLELQKLKNKIKTDRGLGTKDANNNKDIRLGYQNNEYYMSSYNKAKANRQTASRPTTRSDTAAAAGARPNTPPRRGPVPGRSPGKNNLITQEDFDELREAGASNIARLEREIANTTSLQQAFESFGRGL